MPVSRIAFLVALSPVWLGAQAPDTGRVAASSFLAAARAATERFKDVNVAIAESYLKVGPDFPAMGEHWVNGELIMRAELNPARPAILTYAMIGGMQTLTGAVYALALKPGEKPPALFPGAQWHDHVGTVDEESLLFGHDRESGSDDLRLVVMHAWLWVPNPSGPFVTDNWGLPFARVGIAAPADVPQAAARAAAFLSGGDMYFTKLFASVSALDANATDSLAATLESHAQRLQAWWHSRRPASIDVGDVARFEQAWTDIMRDVRRAVGPANARRIDALFAHH